MEYVCVYMCKMYELVGRITGRPHIEELVTRPHLRIVEALTISTSLNSTHKIQGPNYTKWYSLFNRIVLFVSHDV